MASTALDDLTAAAIRQALSAASTGRIEDACRIARSALDAGGDPAALNAVLGAFYSRTGEYESAISHLRIASAAKADDPVIAFNLASALAHQERFSEALQVIPTELPPGEAFLRLQRLRGFLNQQLEDHGHAAEAYERVVADDPNDWETWNNLGNSRRAAGDPEGAIGALQRAVSLAPDAAPVRFNMASALLTAGRPKEAEQAFREMADDFPGDSKPLRELHAMLRAQGREEEALAAIEEASARDPGDMELLLATASQRLLLLDNAGAEEAYRELVRRDPSNALANLGLAVVFEVTNRVDELAALVGEAEQRGVDSEVVNFIRAFDHRRGKRYAEGLAALEKVSDRIETARRNQLLGQLSEGADRYDEAWEAFEQMNEIHRRDPSSPEERAAAYRQLVRSRLETMTDDWKGDWQDHRVEGPASPVFLVGFPRSGTTLLDTFLMGHPRVEVLEEEPTLRGVDECLPSFDQLPAAGEEQVRAAREVYFSIVRKLTEFAPGNVLVDKNPLLMNGLPQVRRLFPDARIILALRHPCDVITSCFATNFKLNDAMSNFLRLDTAAELYDLSFSFLDRFQALMPLPMHVVRYEDLVNDQEAQLRSVMQFLDLDWDEKLLDHEATARGRGRIKTASYAQVVEPIYSRSSGRWQKYRRQLEPVLPILRPWIDKFGYNL